jgi:hypothetical protein
MGFLDNSNIGFSDITIGGGSTVNNQNVVFRDGNTILSAERVVASKSASSDINYILPNKTNLVNGEVLEIINMNVGFNITLVDNQNSNIEGQNSLIIYPQSNISIVLDKDNMMWKIINGI